MTTSSVDQVPATGTSGAFAPAATREVTGTPQRISESILTLKMLSEMRSVGFGRSTEGGQAADVYDGPASNHRATVV